MRYKNAYSYCMQAHLAGIMSPIRHVICASFSLGDVSAHDAKGAHFLACDAHAGICAPSRACDMNAHLSVHVKWIRAFLCMRYECAHFRACDMNTRISVHAIWMRTFPCMRYECAHFRACDMNAPIFVCMRYECSHFRACDMNAHISVHAIWMRTFPCMRYECSHFRACDMNARISVHAIWMRAFPCMRYECSHFRACDMNACISVHAIWMRAFPCMRYECVHFRACDATSHITMLSECAHQHATLCECAHQRKLAWSAPNHYLNQCWNIANWTPENKLQRNFNCNSCIFTRENAFANVVCKMASISSRPQYVNWKACGGDIDLTLFRSVFQPSTTII